jgi:chemotaxis protein MotB
MARRSHSSHGGAWKVAYADFITAMMALFLVLWLTSQDEKIKEAVERSFKNPFMSITKDSTGVIPNKDTQAVKSEKGNFDSASAVELNMLRKMASDLMNTLSSNPETPEENPVNIEMTPDGMRINVFDRAKKAIFDIDSAKFTQYGQWVFSTLAWEISRFAESLNIELEGHTESGRKPIREDYGKWELTVDRANAARRKLLEHGVREGQLRKVAGFGDTMPMLGVVSTSESNRRVTVLLKMSSKNGIK